MHPATDFAAGGRRADPLRRTLFTVGVMMLLAFMTTTIHAQLEFECPEEVATGEPTPQYFMGVGDAAFEQIDYTEAIHMYTCALELKPDYAPAFIRRGYAYTVQGDETRALDDFNTALELDPNLIEAYNNRGVLYMYEGNFGLAIGDFTLVIALDPENAVAYNNRGIAYAAEGSFDLALDDLRTAISIDPDYPAPHAALGATYTALAVQSYNDYLFVAQEQAFVLPSRQPIDIIRAVDEDGEIREFEVWIPFLTPTVE